MADKEYKLKQKAESVQNAIDNALVAVLYGANQDLTESQKEQARRNIGAASKSAAVDGGAVLYESEQELSESQKARARTNIGAMSEDDVKTAVDDALDGYSPNLTGAVRHDAAQSLSETEKARARANIGAAAVGESGGGGTGGGESVLLIDLADTVQVNSAPDDIPFPNSAQTVNVEVDADAILAHTGRIDITYTDVRFPEEIQRATFASRRTDPTASGTTEALVLYAAPLNPWNEENAALLLKIRADGTAVFLYRARAAEQADAAEDDPYAPNHIKNNPVKIVNGYTVIENQRRLSKAKFNKTDKSITLTLEGGVTETMSYTEDSNGVMTSVTLSDGHTITIEEVS